MKEEDEKHEEDSSHSVHDVLGLTVETTCNARLELSNLRGSRVLFHVVGVIVKTKKQSVSFYSFD